jgi:hypothetical protein
LKIVLMNQSLYSQWQIPSLAAGLSSASGDAAAIAALGVVHGTNSGTAAVPLQNQTDQTVTQWVLGPDALVFTEGSFRRATTTIPTGYGIDFKWFGHDIEVEGLVKTIRHGANGSGVIPTDSSGRITLPYVRTVDNQDNNFVTRATKTFMREVAFRHGLTFDETSPTLLRSSGSTYTPTYADLSTAAIDCMRNTHRALHDTIWTGAGKETVFYHSMGVNPLPWIGDGWWVDPYPGSNAVTYRPNRTTAGHQVTQLNVTQTISGGSLNGVQVAGEVVLSTGVEDTQYVHETYVAKLVEQCSKTAEHAKAFDDGSATAVGCVNYNTFIERPLSEVWSSVGNVSGTTLFPVGGGGNGQQRYCDTAAKTRDSVYLANRYTYLGAVKQFGRRTAVWLQPAIDFWVTNDPYWGLMSSDAEFSDCSIAPLLDPVTQEEASAFGLTVGVVHVPTIIFWNSTDNYMRSLFGDAPSAAICRIRDGENGAFLARRNMESRAAGRTNVAVDWSGGTYSQVSANQWYQALAAILTEDMISRIQVTRNRIERAKRQGAAKQSTLLAMTGG